MLSLNNIVLSKFDEIDQTQTLKDLYSIFSETLNKDLTYEEFCIYYFRHKPHYMDISLIKRGLEIIGFICVTFYKHRLGNKTYTICRGATGIKEAYRGGNLPCWQLCSKYINYKLRHPFERLYITAYVANPLVYAMMCKRTRQVYPKEGVSTPPAICRLRENILDLYGFGGNVIAPFILKIHFQVNMSLKDEERILSSNDKDVRYYLDLNPDFRKQIGIMTIIPVSWQNISTCAVRSLAIKPLKQFVRRNFEHVRRHTLVVEGV